MVDDNVASLTSGLWSDNTLGRNNLSGERSLVLVNVDRDSGLVKVRFCLKEILCSKVGAGVRKENIGLEMQSSISKTVPSNVTVEQALSPTKDTPDYRRRSCNHLIQFFLPDSRLVDRNKGGGRSQAGCDTENGLHLAGQTR